MKIEQTYKVSVCGGKIENKITLNFHHHNGWQIEEFQDQNKTVFLNITFSSISMKTEAPNKRTLFRNYITSVEKKELK